MSRIIDHAKDFYRQTFWIGIAISLAWWGGSGADDPYGGVIIFGLAFSVSVISNSLRDWWKERQKPDIGSIVNRPVLVDYRHILLVPASAAITEVPWAAVADADLVIREDDLVMKDRLQASDIVHPGLFQAAKLGLARSVLDLTDDANLIRVNKLIKEKSGRADLWRYPIEVVRDGDGW